MTPCFRAWGPWPFPVELKEDSREGCAYTADEDLRPPKTPQDFIVYCNNNCNHLYPHTWPHVCLHTPSYALILSTSGWHGLGVAFGGSPPTAFEAKTAETSATISEFRRGRLERKARDLRLSIPSILSAFKNRIKMESKMFTAGDARGCLAAQLALAAPLWSTLARWWIRAYIRHLPNHAVFNTWIFQVCKICAFSPEKPTNRQTFYISGRSRYDQSLDSRFRKLTSRWVRGRLLLIFH